jgi:hypothetical protein
VKSILEAESLQKDLNSLADWSKKWQLSFNVDKCKVMHLGKKNEKHSYSMENNGVQAVISSVESEKDLGVQFDDELKFGEHIEDVCTKGHQKIAIIRRTFTYLDQRCSRYCTRV